MHTAQRLLLAAFLAAAAAGPARAQTPPPDIALPEIEPQRPEDQKGKPGTEPILDVQTEIDMATIVTSAAKGVTTVQEAPSVITIITGDEIRARGFRDIAQVMSTVPGWLDVAAYGGQVRLPMVRGTTQAQLYMRDGVSFFDPILNAASMTRVVPLETIKRVEIVTGPGGVLWGANSFLGIVNVITKDAEDVNGLEMSAGYGDGPGSPQDVRAYAMFGKTFFDKSKARLKLFLHASFESWLGPSYRRQQFLASSPAPQPAGGAIYGREIVDGVDRQKYVDTDPLRSWLLNLDGKISLGPVSLYFMYPLGSIHHSLNFSSGAVVNDATLPGDLKYDKGAFNQWNFWERYAILEYKDRFLGERIGLNAKAYYINFERGLIPRVFGSSGALPRGLSFDVQGLNVQRFGGTIDVDIAGPWSWNRVLLGGEAFNESTSQGITNFLAPDPDRLPLVCPLDAGGNYVANCPLPFIFAADRTVVGVFLADQIRPFQSLIIDGGIRFQRGFGKRGYANQFLGSASAVWQFLPSMHLKLNWSQGFRPPVFNNTDANGAAVEFAGNPNLEVEQSQAYQAEVNARVLKGRKYIRELQLRLDYSYTVLDKTIVIQRSAYTNSGKRGIHSVEFLGKLYLQGDHQVTLSYTFLDVRTSDSGRLRSVPNHWVSLGAVFNLIDGMLDINGNLNVLGAYEDPNRISSLPFTVPGGQPGSIARFSDLTLDRLTPVALLQLGVRLRLFKGKLAASAQFYNVLNQRWYYPDVFYDLAPSIEMQPTPAPGFSFFASVTYRP